MATIKSVSKLVVDGDWIESKDQSDCGIRLIQTGNIGVGEYLDRRNKAKFISEETFLRLKCTEVLPGDILISRLPDPIGRACVIPQRDEKAIAAVDCTIIRLNNDILDRRFFLNYTQSPKYFNQLQQFLAGSTRTRISRKNLEKIQLPVPSLDEQHRISTILDKVSDLISLRKQQLAKLDELVKAQFVEMFGDPVINPFGFDNVDIIKVCSSIYGGGTPSKNHPEYFTGAIPWVSPKDMKSLIIENSIDHITEEALANSTAKLIPPNSVLMVIRSGILKHTLPVAINTISVAINQDMKAFVPNRRITAEYLLYYFKAIEKDILGGVRGVTADNIRSLAKIKISK